MIVLNLISPEQKNIIRTKQLFLLLRNVFSLVLFFVIIIAIILILINYSIELTTEYNQTALSSLAVNEKDIKNINDRLENIYNIQKQHTYWPPHLISLFNLVPANVGIKSFDIDKTTQVVHLNGVAKERNDYLQLITALGNNQQVKDLNSPLENLLSKENINFNLTFIYQLTPQSNEKE